MLYNLSGAYLMAGRTQEALVLAEQLVALAPQNPQYQALLSSLRRETAGG